MIRDPRKLLAEYQKEVDTRCHLISKARGILASYHIDNDKYKERTYHQEEDGRAFIVMEAENGAIVELNITYDPVNIHVYEYFINLRKED